jgi:hypothetical protein
MTPDDFRRGEAITRGVGMRAKTADPNKQFCSRNLTCELFFLKARRSLKK